MQLKNMCLVMISSHLKTEVAPAAMTRLSGSTSSLWNMRAPIISATACLTHRGPLVSPYPMEASLAARDNENDDKDDDDSRAAADGGGGDEGSSGPDAPPPRLLEVLVVQEANSSAESMSVLSPATFRVLLLLLLPETAVARGMRVPLETLVVFLPSLPEEEEEADLALSSSSFFSKGPT